MACSSDGIKLVAAQAFDSSSNPGYIYTSNDSGSTWTQRGVKGRWQSAASSADGTKLAAVQSYDASENAGAVYTNTDSGATRAVTTAPAGLWASV